MCCTVMCIRCDVYRYLCCTVMCIRCDVYRYLCYCDVYRCAVYICDVCTLRLQLIAGTNFSVFALRVLGIY